MDARPPEPLTMTSTRLGSTSASLRISTMEEPDSFLDSYVSPEKVVTVRESPLTSILSTCPRLAMVMTSLMDSSSEPPSEPEKNVNTIATSATMSRRYMKLFRIQR